jgi:hypothetical protein
VTNTAAIAGLLAATLAGEAAMAATAALAGLTQPQVGTLLRLCWLAWRPC